MHMDVRRRPLLLLLLLALTAPLAVPSSAPAAELGLNVNGAITGGTRENFDDLATLNAKWARHFVFYDDIDDAGLRYYDNMAATEDQIGVKTLLTVMSARGQQPSSPQAYADFMGRLAARFKGRVEAYEVWNEADEGLFWNGGPQPAAYVDVLKRSYAAIKAADPAAIVVFSPTVGNNYGFVADAYRAGAKGNFDAMAVHTDTACLDRPPDYYYREADGRLGRFTFLAYREVRATMLANEDPKPIWMTEFGWSAARHQCEFGESAGQKPAGVSEADQARFMTQALNCIERDDYLSVALWYNNRDLSGDGKMANMYGLRRFDGSTRPAYDAFRTWNSGGGRSNAECGDFSGPGVEILQPATGAVLPPNSPLYIRAKSGAPDMRRIRFRVPGSGLFPDGLRTLAPEPNGEAEITWDEARQLPVGTHTIEVVAFDESGNPGDPATVEVTKVGTSAPGGSGLAVQWPVTRLQGSGLARTIRGGSIPGVLGGALRVEWQTRRKRGKRRPWVRVHAKTVLARRPFIVRQRLRFPGNWRVRLVFLGKPPHRLTVSCWMHFSTRNSRVRFKCPRGAVPFPAQRR